MSCSHFLKIIIALVLGMLCFSCKEKDSISLISLEFVRTDPFDKDIVINLKEDYLLYENKGYFVVPVGFEFLPPSNDAVFELTKEETEAIVTLYKATKTPKEKRAVYKNKMKTYIEAIVDDQIIAQKQQGYRTEEEKAFFKKVLQLIAAKSKDPKVQTEMTALLEAL